MDFPDILSVTIAAPGLFPAPLDDVLVSLDLHVQGAYYYGTLVGLTDAQGVASIRRSELETHFANDRHLFPMDYRVPLSDCDSLATVKVRGGQEFETQRRAGADNPLVAPEAEALWRRARNAQSSSSAATISLDGRPRIDVELSLGA